MWLFHKLTAHNGDDSKYWLVVAVSYTGPIEVRKHDREVLVLGFLFMPTYYRWYQATHDPKLKDVIIEAGKTQAMRFQENGQYLRSFVAENSLFIDIMMNVGIIFFAACAKTPDRRLRDIALRHCLTTRRVLVRGDGSTAHEGIFDLETGEFLRQATQQGYRGDSCWSRGLAWALYGFGNAYEYSRDPRFLETAESCADYYVTHSNSDGVPPWDFGTRPPESRKLLDTSSAAIAASESLAAILAAARSGERSITIGPPRFSSCVRCAKKHLAKKDKKVEGAF